MSSPKNHLRKIKPRRRKFGKPLRKSYSENIVNKEPVFPKPLEYEDIDAAFIDFVDNGLSITYDGKKMPTFTLFSNQRFSEYTQMWQYTDENNNLLFNFKTITRESNPKVGGNQGGMWNIPGERTYKMYVRNVLEENGTESYEVYSMKQPFSIDMMYRVGFVTDKYSLINEFNMILNEKFKARQYYISPNGHNIPMILEDISDETTYSISDRRIYVQTFSIKVMAYIIKRDSFKVEKYPRRIRLSQDGERPIRPPKADIEEYYNENIENKQLTVTVRFKAYETIVDFTIDTDMVVEDIGKENIRNLRLSINGTPYYIDNGFKFHKNDEIRIRIRQLDTSTESKVVLNGYDPNVTYDKTEDKDIVSEEIEKFEDIVIE